MNARSGAEDTQRGPAGVDHVGYPVPPVASPVSPGPLDPGEPRSPAEPARRMSPPAQRRRQARPGAGPPPAPAAAESSGSSRADRSTGAAGSVRPAAARSAAPPPDPLEQPDPAAAADAAACENLLRCWVRELDLPRPADGVLSVSLDASGTTLSVPVLHWSAAGTHRFGRPRLDSAPPEAAPLDAVTLAALLSRETAHRRRPSAERSAPPGPPDAERAGGTAHPAESHPAKPHSADAAQEAGTAGEAESAHTSPAGEGGAVGMGEGAALVGRVADSLQHTARFLTERRARPQAPCGTGHFLETEQALVFGHPLHPAPKSREGLSEAELAVYSPELRGSFQLHWYAAEATVVAGDSAWSECGTAVPAARLAERVAGASLTARLPAGTVPLPLHPWQARELRHDPAVQELLGSGQLTELGPAGERWHPTSSVRTVCRPGDSVMLKLSLGLRITNSRRDNLRKELLRGVEVHRLLESGLAAQWRAAFPDGPGFDIVRDPAWLGTQLPNGASVAGLDTVIRHNPFAPADRAHCVAGLTSPRPVAETPDGPLRSRLAELIAALSARSGDAGPAVAVEWFRRYLEVVIRPVLWLDAHAGVALEAHQQNTLVLLSPEGWPAGGRYRDNQGYYFRTSRREELEGRLPDRQLGAASDSFVSDAVTNERFAYYLGVNNVLGLIGAFGSQGLADEERLLTVFRCFLAETAHGWEDGASSPLPALLLDSPVLRCKANLLTRLHGMDELVGPVESQSVYSSISNPIAR